MENLKKGKEIREKDIHLFSGESLAAISMTDLQAALAYHMQYGVTDIFDDSPGLTFTKLEVSPHQISPFSLLKKQAPPAKRPVEGKTHVAPSLSRSYSSETQIYSSSMPEGPRPSRIKARPVPKIAIEDFTQALLKTKTIEEALAYARASGGAGLAHMALHDIKGAQGKKGGGFIVGAEPSQEAEREGRLFAGDEGVLMKRLLASVGISFDDVGSAPALPWRPPGGRDPLPEEVAVCTPLLKHFITLSEPKWILTFGSLPARMLLEEEKAPKTMQERYLQPAFRLSQVRGRWHEVLFTGQSEKKYIFPLNSPARLKNSVRNRQLMWQDLQFFRQGLADF